MMYIPTRKIEKLKSHRNILVDTINVSTVKHSNA